MPVPAADDERSTRAPGDAEEMASGFQSWLGASYQPDRSRPEPDLDTLLARYLGTQGVAAPTIDQYIHSVQSLHDGTVYRDLEAELVRLGARPKRAGNAAYTGDPLESYQAASLHAVFLYTSEDRAVGPYIAANYGAIDTLSGPCCAIHLSVDQFANAEDGYDYLTGVDVIREAKSVSVSALPGMFFWDRKRVSDYVPFGSAPDDAKLTEVLRTVFEETGKDCSIAAVGRAKQRLAKGAAVAKRSTGQPSLWRDLLPLLLLVCVVIAVLIAAAQLVPGWLVATVFIAAILIILLLLVVMLLRAGDLSEGSATALLRRVLDSLPVLRGKDAQNGNDTHRQGVGGGQKGSDEGD